MDDNTEVVERLMETFANFHCGHDAAPRVPGEPSEAEPEVVPEMRAFEFLTEEERAEFAQRLERGGRVEAAAGEPGPDDRKLVLVVSGGAPGERYSYEAEVTGSGQAAMRVLDQISGRDERGDELTLGSAQVDDLFRRAASAEVLTGENPHPSFVPDSLVGTLIITDGQIEKRIHFAVDTESDRPREPAGPDVTLLPSAGLLVRNEHASQGVRSILEILADVPALTP
jgi:hypothetical protein